MFAKLIFINLLWIMSLKGEVIEEKLDHPLFGQIALQRPSKTPKGLVLLFAGKNGQSIASAIAQLDYLVAPVLVDQYLQQPHQSAGDCVNPPADLEQLIQVIRQHYPAVSDLPPILVGEGAGAALSYTMLAQAPAGHFHTGVAVDFCPELLVAKPLCFELQNLIKLPRAKNKQLFLKPGQLTSSTWFVFQNRPRCNAAVAKQFLQQEPLARLAELPGAEGVKSWQPAVSALLQWLDPHIEKQVRPDASISGVPLTEVPATGGPRRPQFAVMFSGDGGWAQLDRSVTLELAKEGLPTVGWDSFSYFWKAREPHEVAMDLDRVLRHYLQSWKKERIVLIGYSFGANVLPVVVNHLAQDLRDRIDLLALLGLSAFSSFEFHLSDWLNDQAHPNDRPVTPELKKMAQIKRLCVYGTEEKDAICPKLQDFGIVAEKMAGDHHFGADYQGLARRLLEQLPPLKHQSAEGTEERP